MRRTIDETNGAGDVISVSGRRFIERNVRSNNNTVSFKSSFNRVVTLTDGRRIDMKRRRAYEIYGNK